MDRGEKLSARIMKLEQVKNPWDRIRFEGMGDREYGIENYLLFKL
jgi:hypothetical protein